MRWWTGYDLRLSVLKSVLVIACRWSKTTQPVADLGEGGRANAFPPQEFDSLPTQRVPSPLCTILRYPFSLTDLKKFFNAPLAPIYTNFEGAPKKRWKKRAPKKSVFFLSKFSKKCLKNAFYQKFACGAENFVKNYALYSGLEELTKSIWST